MEWNGTEWNNVKWHGINAFQNNAVANQRINIHGNGKAWVTRRP